MHYPANSMATIRHNHENPFENMAMRLEKVITELSCIGHSALSFVIAVLFSVTSFFAPAKALFVFSAILITSDVITAAVAVFMKNKREQSRLWDALLSTYAAWNSRRALDSIIKIIVYGLLIGLSYCMGRIFTDEQDLLKVIAAGMSTAKLALGLICYVELISIIENIDKSFETNMMQVAKDYISKFIGKK